MKHIAITNLSGELSHLIESHINLVMISKGYDTNALSIDGFEEKLRDGEFNDAELIMHVYDFHRQGLTVPCLLAIIAVKNSGVQKLLHAAYGDLLDMKLDKDSLYNLHCFIGKTEDPLLLDILLCTALKAQTYSAVFTIAEKLNADPYYYRELILGECYAYGIGTEMNEDKGISHLYKAMKVTGSKTMVELAIKSMFIALEPRVAQYLEIIFKILTSPGHSPVEGQLEKILEKKNLFPLSLLFDECQKLDRESLKNILPLFGHKLNCLLRILPMPKSAACVKDRDFGKAMVDANNFHEFCAAFKADLEAVSGQPITGFHDFYTALMKAVTESSMLALLRQHAPGQSSENLMKNADASIRKADILEYGFLRLAEMVFERPLPQLKKAIKFAEVQGEHAYFEVDEATLKDKSFFIKALDLSLEDYVNYWNRIKENLNVFTVICKDSKKQTMYIGMLVRPLLLPDEMIVNRNEFIDSIRGHCCEIDTTILLQDVLLLDDQSEHLECLIWFIDQISTLNLNAPISSSYGYSRSLVLWQSLHGVFNVRLDHGYIVSARPKKTGGMEYRYYDHDRAKTALELIPPELELMSNMRSMHFVARGVGYDSESSPLERISWIQSGTKIPPLLERTAVSSLGLDVFSNVINNQDVKQKSNERPRREYINLPMYCHSLRPGLAKLYAANDRVDWLAELLNELTEFPTLLNYTLHGLSQMSKSIEFSSLYSVALSNDSTKVLKYLYEEFGIGHEIKEKAEPTMKKPNNLVKKSAPKILKVVAPVEENKDEKMLAIFRNIFNDPDFEFVDKTDFENFQYVITCKNKRSSHLALITKELKKAWSFSKNTDVAQFFAYFNQAKKPQRLIITLARAQESKWLQLENNSKFYSAIKPIKTSVPPVKSTPPTPVIGKYDGQADELKQQLIPLAFGLEPTTQVSDTIELAWRVDLKERFNQATGRYHLTRNGKTVSAETEFFEELCKRLNRFSLQASFADHQFKIEIRKGINPSGANILTPTEWDRLIKQSLLSLPIIQKKKVQAPKAITIPKARANAPKIAPAPAKAEVDRKALLMQILEAIFEPDIAKQLFEKISICAPKLKNKRYLQIYFQFSHQYFSIDGRSIKPVDLFNVIYKKMGNDVSKLFNHPLTLSFDIEAISQRLKSPEKMHPAKHAINTWLSKQETNDERAQKQTKNAPISLFFTQNASMREAAFALFKSGVKKSGKMGDVHALRPLINNVESRFEAVNFALYRIHLIQLLPDVIAAMKARSNSPNNIAPFETLYKNCLNIWPQSAEEQTLFEKTAGFFTVLATGDHTTTALSAFYFYISELDQKPIQEIPRFEYADLIVQDTSLLDSLSAASMSVGHRHAEMQLVGAYLKQRVELHKLENLVTIPRTPSPEDELEDAADTERLFHDLHAVQLRGCESLSDEEEEEELTHDLFQYLDSIDRSSGCLSPQLDESGSYFSLLN